MQHIESGEQKALFEWAELQKGLYPELFWLNGSANGQYITNPASRKLANALGRKKGYPDVQLPVPNKQYIGLYIEMKAGNNTTTPEQKIWLEGLKKLGHCTCVCYSCQEAIDVILEYLANRNQHECALLSKVPNCS